MNLVADCNAINLRGPVGYGKDGYPQGSRAGTSKQELLNDPERTEYLKSYLASLVQSMK
ncbi:hypothetical protein ACLOJK_011366 [Asimina triloba]